LVTQWIVAKEHEARNVLARLSWQPEKNYCKKMRLSLIEIGELHSQFVART